MKAGFSLSREERGLYRNLGRRWIMLYKELNDKVGVRSIRRDLNMLHRPPVKEVDVQKEVMG